MQALICMDQ